MVQEKLSFYNTYFLSADGDAYLWNTLTGALIKIDADGIAWMQSFGGRDDGSEYHRTLLQNGCIVNTNINETVQLIKEERATYKRPYSDMAHFMIVPGLGCNYHCYYCFERAWNLDKTCRMSKEVEEAIVALLDAHIKHGAKRCFVEWFGGEPLLYLDELVSLSGRLIERCDAMGIPYGASITTNGSLLSDSVLNDLVKARVSGAQITVDGPRNQYCRAKGATPQQFDDVINNIRLACNVLKRVTIRINTDGTNYDEIKELVDYLLKEKGLEGKVRLWIAPIRSLDSPVEATSLRDVELLLRSIEHYCEKSYPQQRFYHRTPRRISASCGRLCASSISVGPRGELYACDEHVGHPELEIGNIVTGETYPAAESVAAKMRMLQHDRQCLACKFLPLCLGGCANVRAHGKPVFDCPTHIENYVNDFARSHDIKLPTKLTELERL